VAKGRPRSFIKGSSGGIGHYTPQRTEDYERLVKLCAFPEMRGRGVLVGPISLQLNLYFEIPESWPRKRQNSALALMERPTTKPDIDNVLKIFGDALNGVVWQDDKQIVETIVRKYYSKDPKAVAIISQIEGANDE